MADVGGLLSRLQDTHIVEEDKVLSFAGQSHKLDTAEDAKKIVQAIRDQRVMEVLNLSGNTIGVEAAAAIGKALEPHPELRRAIWHDIFTSRLRSEIPKAMKSLCDAMMMNQTRLVELNLSDNAFGPDGVKSVEQLLRCEVCHSLEILRFNNMGLGTGGATILASSLCKLHESSVKAAHPLKLKVFIAGRNRLENKGATELAKAFKAIGTLEEVCMPQNGIYHEGITAIADALSSNPDLSILNLNDNTVTSKGAQALAKALRCWPRLKELDLGDCLLKNSGAKLIAGGLMGEYGELEVVNLSSNEIKSDVGEVILDALKGKEKLRVIDLNVNTFGSGCEAVESLAEKYGLSDALQSLDDDDGSDSEEDEDDDEVVVEGTTPTKDESWSRSPRQRIEPEPDVTAMLFREGPTAARLLGLGHQAPQLLLKEYKSCHLLGSGVSVADELVKLGQALPPSDHPDSQQLYILATSCADELLRAAMSDIHFPTSEFSNRVLERLGLIKCEEEGGKVKAGGDSIRGVLSILTHCCTQAYFPRSTTDIFQFFIARPCKQLDVFGDMKHKLLQSLYQC